MAQLKKAFLNQIYRPHNFFLLIRIMLSRSSQMSLESALKLAIRWIGTAQDASGCGGVAAGYSLKNGWEEAYPETTGYIIETFYDYAKYSGDSEFKHRARRMADWLISIQMPSGGFQGGPVNVAPKPIVFNTGMILFGLLRAWQEESEKSYLTAAIKAGNWLVEVQDEDGAWRRHTYKAELHAYKTRVAWGLIELWKVTGKPEYIKAAKKNLHWAILQQYSNGFFNHAAFEKEIPFTHTIAYTIRGLLESGIILKNQKMINAALKPAERLFRYFEINRTFPGQFNEHWKPTTRSACVTGCAQFSVIWLRIYQEIGDARFLNAALKMNDWLMGLQIGSVGRSEIKGAIMGSTPIWGTYMPYYFPNWAAKFFCDAMLLQHNCLNLLIDAA